MARKLKGVQEPSFSAIPRHSGSEGPLACDLAAGYDMPPDPWQRKVMEGWLATLKSGKWSAGDVGISVPRQNGKNGILEFCELYMAAILGLKILHTAHEVKTCRKHFMRMKHYFENAGKYPELAAIVQSIRSTNGQEAIYLTNGGSIEFIARSKSSGRGFTVDVIVCDEAQELTDEQMEAMQPAISSAPSGNPMTIYAGTPTPPTSPGTVFARLHKEAHSGKSRRLCWFEWGVKEIGDVEDRKRWEATNPSLGIRLLPSVIESEVKKFSPDGFARERLGWWDETADRSSDIDLKNWAACRTTTPATEGYAAFCVKFSPDGRHVSLAACRKPPKGSDLKPHVELIEYKTMSSGTDWIADWMAGENAQGATRWRESLAIVVDGRVGTSDLINKLIDRKVSKRVIWTVGAGQMQDAVAMFEQGVNSHLLTQFGQPALDEGVGHALHREIGNNGGFGYESSSENVDVTPVEAVALAYWAARTSKRNPGRHAKAVAL